MQELLAGGLVVPFAIAADQFKQMLDRRVLAIGCNHGDREIEARLMIVLIAIQTGFKHRRITSRTGFLG